MAEIVRQGLVHVVCGGPIDPATGEHAHPFRSLGDLLVYLYDDGTVRAGFRAERLPKGHTGVWIGKGRGEELRCEYRRGQWECRTQRRLSRERLSALGRHLLDTPQKVLDIARLPG